MKPYPDMNKEPNVHLPSEKFPVPLLVLMETDSTNRHLTQLCDEQGIDIPEFMTVITERQTAGKGQRGNSWNRKMVKTLHSASYFTLHSLKRVNNSFFPSSSHSPSKKNWMNGLKVFP